MIQVPILSQRDPKWSAKSLGFSNLSIGLYGCALTALTALLGETDVSKVNDTLKDKGAFIDSLLWWTKVQDAYPKIKFIYRYYTYENSIVADYVYNKKIPVIVEVDAAPIGSPRTSHFVLFLGDQKLFDPWTGTIKNTADYPVRKGFVAFETTPSLSLPERYDKIKNILYGGDTDTGKVAQAKRVYEAP